MEKYKIINLERLERKEYFDYFQSVGTIIQITKKIDITNLIQKYKNNNLNFQALFLYTLYKIINEIQNFKYDIIDGKLIEWEKIVPTFSSFNNEKKLFLRSEYHMLCMW